MGRGRKRLCFAVLSIDPSPPAVDLGGRWEGEKSQACPAGLLLSHHGHPAQGGRSHVGCAWPQSNIPWPPSPTSTPPRPRLPP